VTLITCDKCDDHRQTFTNVAYVDLQALRRVQILYMCVKTVKPVKLLDRESPTLAITTLMNSAQP